MRKQFVCIIQYIANIVYIAIQCIANIFPHQYVIGLVEWSQLNGGEGLGQNETFCGRPPSEFKRVMGQ